MRVEDAPPPGWYPDPIGGSRLRWWEGTDWADRWRAPPTAGVVAVQQATAHERLQAYDEEIGVPAGSQYSMGSLSRQDSEAIINQVRMAARAEAERAAGLFRDEARTAARSISPLISEYTSKILRWVRLVSVIAIVLLIGWLAFQIFAQISLFEWIGDRIDNLTDNVGDDSGAVIGWFGSEV